MGHPLDDQLDADVEEVFPQKSERFLRERERLRQLARESPRLMNVTQIRVLCDQVFGGMSRSTFYRRLRDYFDTKSKYPQANEKVLHKAEVLDTIHAIQRASTTDDIWTQ